MPKFLALIVAILIIGGIYFYQKGGEFPAWLSSFKSDKIKTPTPDLQSSENKPVSTEEVSINSYAECLAAGNKPLQDAPDKCLTKDGHVFIEGVIEE